MVWGSGATISLCFSCSGICGTPGVLYGRLPRVPLEYRSLGLLVVVFYLLFYIILFFIYLFVLFLASILQSSSACLLDTAAGLLSVAYAPFGTVCSWYCLYRTVIGSALG